MNLPPDSIFIEAGNGLPLLTDRGGQFLGLSKSSSPDLNERVSGLFQYLNTRLAFRDGPEGEVQQQTFNTLLRYAYPEIMIDLADLIFVQHERPMVFLNKDHIHMNRRFDPEPEPEDVELFDMRREVLFRSLADSIRLTPELFNDPELVRYLSESYSFYLWLSQNFPWEDPLKDMIELDGRSVLDVATGLAGFSLIHGWPESHPPLILTDCMPFIIEGLNHYRQLLGNQNVTVQDYTFPSKDGMNEPVGQIYVSKFLHHLERDARRGFLKWAHDQLLPGGRLIIVDTDLEFQVLKEAEDPEYRSRLMPGYLETLVRIEEKFCHHTVEDVRALGFSIEHFDFHEYYDETDAYSHYPGENLPLKFLGFDLLAKKG